jgi:hypothetical protein
MLPEGNARDRSETRSPEGIDPAPRTTRPDDTNFREYEGSAERRLCDTSKDVGKPIDIVFDLDDPEQARSLQGHGSAFGDEHTEIKPVGDGKVVLRVYPGGARRLL